MSDALANKLRIRSQLCREFLAEFLGTFILIVFGDGSVAQFVLSKGELGSAHSIHWSWGVGVMMGLYASGGVSGGHINPAVSLALAVVGRFPWHKVPIYMLAQYCGAFCASFFVYIIYMDALDHFDGGTRMVVGVNGTAGIWATYPQEFVTTPTALGDQIFGTAMLLICVMAITDERNMNPSKGLVPICVGLSVFVIGMTYHLNCGYAINPARDLGPRLFTLAAGWGDTTFTHRDYGYFWIPILGPHLGAIIGCVLYILFVGLH